MSGSSFGSTYLPSISETKDVIGVILLFIPYIIIMLPFLHDKIVKKLGKLYLHFTPRNDWNKAVNNYPPRRTLGYILSIIFLFTPGVIIYINNDDKTGNTYVINIIQYFIYISIPILLSIIRPNTKISCDFIDIIIFCFITIPLEFSEINGDNGSHNNNKFLPDIQFDININQSNWPNISLLKLTAFNIALFIFYIFRPLNNIKICIEFYCL